MKPLWKKQSLRDLRDWTLPIAMPQICGSNSSFQWNQIQSLGTGATTKSLSPCKFQPVSTSLFSQKSWANLDAPETPSKRSRQGALVVNSQLELGKAGTPTYPVLSVALNWTKTSEAEGKELWGAPKKKLIQWEKTWKNDDGFINFRNSFFLIKTTLPSFWCLQNGPTPWEKRAQWRLLAPGLLPPGQDEKIHFTMGTPLPSWVP